MAIDVAQFHQVFFEECFEGLDLMEARLLILEPGEVDPEEINAIFRTAHSIKGGSQTFGFPEIAAFTHLIETCLGGMREGSRPVTPECVSTLLHSVDALRDMLIAAEEGGEYDKEKIQGRRQELVTLLGADFIPAGDSATAGRDTGKDKEVTGDWRIIFRPLPGMLRNGNDPLRIIRELAGLGALSVEADSAGIPPFAELEPERCYLSWTLHLQGAVTRKAVDDVFAWVEDDCELTITPLPAGDKAPAPESAATASPGVYKWGGGIDRRQSDRRHNDRRQGDRRFPLDRRRGDRRAGGAVLPGSSSIRVDTNKFDSLFNLVGELVMTQSTLAPVGETFEAGDRERLRDGLARLERQTRELQENLLHIRMFPIQVIFSRFPRLVHDVCEELGKKIDLMMVGEQTEVDKAIIEKIGDPLTHLVRNSLDHGIERPQERLAAGKSETGIIHLEASLQDGEVVIEIRDDGRGLDQEEILQKAMEQGLVAPDHNLREKQIYELIFQPGFTTAEQVSDISGRGVGMDVVRRNINELGGYIDIESAPGVGSAITIRLPQVTAVLEGQLAVVGDESYLVPQDAIVDTTQILPGMIGPSTGQDETVTFQDEPLSLIRLGRLFHVNNTLPADPAAGQLLVVKSENGRCGLLVDDLTGSQRVVIKPLETHYQKVEGILGGGILASGSVALILDIPAVMRLARQGSDARN